MEKVYGKRRREENGRVNLRNDKQLFEDEIAKLEMIRDRYPVSFREAKAALNSANGDLVEAIEYLEDKHLSTKHLSTKHLNTKHLSTNQDMQQAESFMEDSKEEVQDYIDEAIERTSEYMQDRTDQAKHQAWNFWHKIQESTIAVRRQEDVVARIPAAVGIAGLAGSLINPRIAMVGVIGLAGALGSGYSLELQKLEKHQQLQKLETLENEQQQYQHQQQQQYQHQYQDQGQQQKGLYNDQYGDLH